MSVLLGSVACAKPAPQPEPPPLVLDGFTSRETAGEDPVFDLKARRASVIKQAQLSEHTRETPGGLSALMRIEDIHFTLFRKGRTSGVVAAKDGFFNTQDKTVELMGGVTYHSLDDSLHVRAERMSWDPRASVLRCDTDVRGNFRSYQFSSARLDLWRTENVLYLHKATFIGPG